MRKDAAPCLVVLRIKFPKCGPPAVIGNHVGGWPKNLTSLAITKTVGAPSLRFLQGRERCCLYHGRRLGQIHGAGARKEISVHPWFTRTGPVSSSK